MTVMVFGQGILGVGAVIVAGLMLGWALQNPEPIKHKAVITQRIQSKTIVEPRALPPLIEEAAEDAKGRLIAEIPTIEPVLIPVLDGPRPQAVERDPRDDPEARAVEKMGEIAVAEQKLALAERLKERVERLRTRLDETLDAAETRRSEVMLTRLQRRIEALTASGEALLDANDEPN